MSKKLSRVQCEILTLMTNGECKLYSTGMVSSWLGDNGVSKSVNDDTIRSLLNQGYIECADTDSTPWYRRDYVISVAGRAALERA